jgi:hypothetical protein
MLFFLFLLKRITIKSLGTNTIVLIKKRKQRKWTYIKNYMKTPTKPINLFFVLILSVSLSCEKKQENPCEGKTQPSGKFLIKELIGDTAFTADTVFRDNYVQFEAVDKYKSVSWKLGSDPRDWAAATFNLSFSTVLGMVPIRFTGKANPDSLCFPGDNGTYTSMQNLTVVEQVDKSRITISPLVGRYRGYFTDNPSDSFTIRMDYFDSAKYDAGITGNKNFYWLSNMPNGFIGTTTASCVYEELREGQPVEMGYKCFVFGTNASLVQGRGWLSNDTLYINYGNDVNGRKKFIGKKL